jgi:hypothetical protein
MAYLLAGIATPGNEADPRRLKELHFVGSVWSKATTLVSQSESTRATSESQDRRTVWWHTCCFLGPFLKSTAGTERED